MPQNHLDNSGDAWITMDPASNPSPRHQNDRPGDFVACALRSFMQRQNRKLYICEQIFFGVAARGG
jgi:hypothetical protein